MTRRKLLAVIPKVDFVNLEVKDVVDFMRNAAHFDIHVLWAALQAASIDPKQPVNLQLTNVSVRQLLDIVCRDMSANIEWAWIIDDGLVRISSRDELAKTPVTRIYRLEDILTATTELEGLPRREQFPTDECGNSPRDILARDILMGTIQQAIDPSSWQPIGTVGQINELAGDFILTQDPLNHALVRALLVDIRRSIEKKRVSFGLAIVEGDGAELKALRAGLAGAKDIGAALQNAGDEKKVAVRRCRVQQAFLTRPMQLSQDGPAGRSYDVTLTPVERRGGGLLVEAKWSSTWPSGTGKDKCRVSIPAGGFEWIELIPPGESGGIALVVWNPK